MAEQSNVRLNLVGAAENVAVVRSVLGGLAERAGIDPADLNDIRTAVTEACNNVVMHAYRGEPGPMDLAIALGAGSIAVTVRDRGIGIGEHAERPDGAGIGLHVIRTLAREASFDEPPGGGTRVRMELPARGQSAATQRLRGGPDRDLSEMGGFAASLSVAPVSLAHAVVPRLACAFAARAHFSTDRLSDVQLLADALVAHAGSAVCGDHLSLGIVVRPRDLQLRIGPLRVGQGDGLLRASNVDGVGKVIEKLIDRHEVLAGDSHETLALSVLDPR